MIDGSPLPLFLTGLQLPIQLPFERRWRKSLHLTAFAELSLFRSTTRIVADSIEPELVSLIAGQITLTHCEAELL